MHARIFVRMYFRTCVPCPPCLPPATPGLAQPRPAQPSAAQPGPAQPSPAAVPIDFDSKTDAELRPIRRFFANPVLQPSAARGGRGGNPQSSLFYHDNVQSRPQTWPYLSQSAHPWKQVRHITMTICKVAPKHGTTSRNPRTPGK